MTAPINSADPQYRALLDRLFPVGLRGQDMALRTFELILSNDVNGLKEWVSGSADRVNRVATDKLLHPLHVCAMTGDLACAKVLVETGVCEINAQDRSGATPLHHTAVRGNQEMLTYFLRLGALRLADRYGGTYASILRQVQAPNPEAQIFCYKDDEDQIVQGNGHDFKRVTGATFLDKEYRIRSEEWIKLWEKKADEPGFLPPSLQQRYEEFSKNPPLLYVERHPRAGWDVCAGQDFKPGMVIGEYLGDVCDSPLQFTVGDSRERLEEAHADAEYIMENIDGAQFRGVIPMCNDSFPNATCFSLYNVRGIPVRKVLVAIQPIEKGEPIHFTYGLGHGVRFGKRVEIRNKAFINYYRKECAQGFVGFVNRAILANDSALREGHLPDAEQNMPFQAFLYLFITPAAMLRLVCEGIIDIDQVKLIFTRNPQLLEVIKRWINAEDFPYQWVQLDHFYQTAFRYFDQLKSMPKRERKKAIAALNAAIDSSDTNALVQLMGGVPKEFALHANEADSKRDDP